MPDRSSHPAVWLGIALLLTLIPLPLLGDLRHHVLPYVLLALFGTLLLYAGFLVLHHRDIRIDSRTILLGALLMRAVVFPLQPSLSDDAWRYVWDGRLLLNGESPYHHVPADELLSRYHDDWLAVQGYPETNTIYPPIAQLLFASSVAFAAPVHAGPDAAYYFYKLLVLAADMVGIWLLIGVLKRLRLPKRNALIYAWHPLVIVELAGQGHTDVFWVLAVGLAVAAYLRGEAGRGFPWLAFGVGVRLFPALIVPVWSRFVPKREVVAGALLSIPFLALLVVLFDPEAFNRYSTVASRFTNFYEFNGGAYLAAKSLLDGLHVAPSNRIAGLICTGVMLAGIAAVTLYPIRKRTVSTLIGRVLAIVSLQIALTSKVHVWYFVLPLYLLAIKPGTRLRAAWIWMGLAAPLTYLFYLSEPNHERLWVLIAEWGGGIVLALAGIVRSALTKKTPDSYVSRALTDNRSAVGQDDS